MKDSGPMNGVKTDSVVSIKRNQYDLSHYSMQCGVIGSVTALSTIPVIAGDSIQINLGAVVRLSPLRRNMYVDCVVDQFAFYIPHRHIYGTDWIDFIKGGVDEAVTLGTTTAANLAINCLGLKVEPNAANPSWLMEGLQLIYNNYFLDPSDTAGALSASYFTTVADDTALFGLPCCHLKTLTTTTMNSTLAAADYQLALDAGTVNLHQFAQQQARLGTEQARDWYGLKYRDVMSHTFGSRPNTDADQRPTLLMRSTRWMSGYDVDGTDDATLGTYSGKAQALCQLNMPFKFIPEHGAIWILQLVRLPFIHSQETHYLVKKSEPTYKEIAGDPEVIANEPPLTLNLNETFIEAGSVALGVIPYAQWYRTHPSFVNTQYVTTQGHPFITFMPTTRNEATYIKRTLYDDIFSTMQLFHWNSQAHLDVQVRRFVPDPQVSIFAGTS